MSQENEKMDRKSFSRRNSSWAYPVSVVPLNQISHYLFSLPVFASKYLPLADQVLPGLTAQNDPLGHSAKEYLQ